MCNFNPPEGGWTVFSLRAKLLDIRKNAATQLDQESVVNFQVAIDNLIAELHNISAHYPDRPDPNSCLDVDKGVPISESMASDFFRRAAEIYDKIKK